jgi:hypothetical protein
VWNDTLTLNLTVDWEWVKDNLDIILSNSSEVAMLFGFDPSNIDIPPFEATLSGPQFLELLDQSSLLSSDFLGDLQVNGVNATELTNIIEDFLNISLGNVFQNISIDGVLFPFSNETSVTIRVYNSTFNALTNVISISNANLEFSDGTVLTISAVDITLTNATLASLLPSGTERYFIPIDSPYTVMHNSSSPHAIASAFGELTAAAFQSCSPSSSAVAPEYLVKNHPLPLTPLQSIEIRVILSLFASIFILVSFTAHLFIFATTYLCAIDSFYLWFTQFCCHN